MRQQGRRTDRRSGAGKQRGFSIMELAVATLIFLIITAVAIPSVTRSLGSYRASSSARNIASELALAKMRAAESFTQAQLNCTLSGTSCQLQTCTTKGTSSCTTFSNEGGPINLAAGTTFGYGSITAPAGTQTTIANTATVLFNSRGIPVTSAGVMTASDAIYLTNGNGDTYAVTVYPSGKTAVWEYINGAWTAL